MEWIDGIVEVGPSPVHFVEKSHTWHVIFFGLAPGGIGLGLTYCNPFKYVKYTHQEMEVILDF